MRYFIIFMLSFLAKSYSQNITIRGKAHASHIGKEIVLSDYTDYITYGIMKESADTVDSNGYFELKFQSSITKPILINIDNLVGKIYVQPNFVYGIYFPEKDSLTNNQEGTETIVDISVYGKDSTELNALIIDFNTEYNNVFMKVKDNYLSPSKLNPLLDTFLLTCKKRYVSIKNTYFKNYIEYSFANFYSAMSRGRNFLNKNYLEGKSIQYDNYEYMQFFNAYFKGYLNAFASSKNGGNIYNSINQFSDYQDLKKQFKSDNMIFNDTIRELVILKGLLDFYYSPGFDQMQVKGVIEQIYHESLIQEHKKIASNILQTINHLQPGAKAPDFLANNKTGTKTYLSSYTGKYIYLNFFSTESEISQKEMKKMVDLRKKFNDKVTFISVCLDDSVKNYIEYLKANPKQDWIILHQEKNSSARQAYNVKSLSGFFLINPKMELVQSPALMPSEGIEYKFNALFRPRKRNIVIGIR